MALARAAHAEVQVGRRHRAPAAGAHRAEPGARGHRLPLLDRDGGQVQVGDVVFAGAHGDGQARVARDAGVADGARPTAATTSAPAGAAMSTPRCCPAAYGSEPLRNAVSTSPRTGHVQSPAARRGSRAGAARSGGRRVTVRTAMTANVDRAGRAVGPGGRSRHAPSRRRHTAGRFVTK